jgi:hypothetical protein
MFDQIPDPSSPNAPEIAHLVKAMDPKDVDLAPTPPEHLTTPPDPLCPSK